MQDSYMLPIVDRLLFEAAKENDNDHRSLLLEVEGEDTNADEFLQTELQPQLITSGQFFPRAPGKFYILSDALHSESLSLQDSKEDNEESIDDLSELVPALKCLKCSFVTLDKPSLINHYRITHHMKIIKKKSQLNDKSENPKTESQLKQSLLVKDSNHKPPLSVYKVCKFKENKDLPREPADNKSLTVGGQEVTVLFVCGNCNKEFGSQEAVKNHMLKEHNAQLNQNPNADHRHARELSIRKSKKKRKFKKKANVEKVQCDVCKEMYATKKGLQRHMRAVHSGIKPFVCPVCGHSTTHKNHLILHTRQHTGERPFACKFCDYRAGDHNTLRRHNFRHLQVKPYVSPVCTFAATQKHVLTRHLQKFHPDVPDTKRKRPCKPAIIKDPILKRNSGMQATENETSNSRQLMSDIFLHEETSEEPLDHGGVTIPAT